MSPQESRAATFFDSYTPPAVVPATAGIQSTDLEADSNPRGHEWLGMGPRLRGDAIRC